MRPPGCGFGFAMRPNSAAITGKTSAMLSELSGRKEN
jgi:hypothetical protein